MSKQLQRYACVVLAVMMVWAVMPVLGVAESPTTPSDLPDVTAVPTEVPTEEPAEVPTEVPADVPTEVPVEEEPPVLVEEVEQPPMLMVAADELAQFGLVTNNGGTYELTWDANGKPCITLKTGNWYNRGSILAGQVDVQDGADLTINGGNHYFDTMNVSGILTNGSSTSNLLGKVTINGGTLTDWGGHFDELHVNGGSANFRGGTSLMTVSNKANVTILDGTANIRSLEAKDSNISVMNSAKVISASLTNCVITADNVGFTHMAVNNTSGTFGGGGWITNFYIEKLPTNGTLTTSSVSIGNVELPEDVLEALAKEYADKVFSLVGGEIPPTGTYPTEYGFVSIEYQGLHLMQFTTSDVVYFEYTPIDAGRIPYDVTTWQYEVKCSLGPATSDLSIISIPVPVAPGTREIVLSGGTIEKVYDGKADFVEAWVTDPQWTLDGEPFMFDAGISMACKVTGTASSKDSGTHEGQSCTMVEAYPTGVVPLPDDVKISTTGKVNVVITKKPVTISGTVYKNVGDYTIKMIDYIKQGNVEIVGLAEGDTVEQLDPNAEMEAFDANDWYMTRIRNYTKGESYQVVRLTETKNYIPQPSELFMCIRKQGEASFTHGNYMEETGTWDEEMQLNPGDYNEDTVQIKYSFVNDEERFWRDSFDEELLGKERDTYWVSAIFPEQGPFEKRIITLEFRYIRIPTYTISIPASVEIAEHRVYPNNPYADQTRGEKQVSCSITGIDRLYLTITSQNGGKLTWDSAKKGTGAQLGINGSDVKIPYDVYVINGGAFERATSSIYLTSGNTGFLLRCVIFDSDINSIKDTLAGGTWTDVLTFSFSTTSPASEP